MTDEYNRQPVTVQVKEEALNVLKIYAEKFGFTLEQAANYLLEEAVDAFALPEVLKAEKKVRKVK